MPIAILDPYSGISGDMTLGALLHLGLDPDWLRALPATLGLDGVTVRIQDVRRAGIACKKVDFDIPPQPHGRHIKEIRRLVAAAGVVPPEVQEKADRAFTAIANAEAEIHGTTPEKVHLHEVGAVDAILDVVGSVWGFAMLGVEQVYCGTLSVGDGFVEAAHGTLPVPAPATLKLLEGLPVRSGPEGAGELVTPTGAALVKVLSAGTPPREYVPIRSGFGAGTKDPAGRANALRIVLAEPVQADRSGAVQGLVMLAADIDDLSGEYVAAAGEALRSAGALDVVMLPTIMKKGRPGLRIEVLAEPGRADELQRALFAQTSTLGVRRWTVERHALDRSTARVEVLGQAVSVKVTILPDGTRRAKPEFEDVYRVAQSTGRTARDIFMLASAAAEEHL
ncbi:MAG TPA: nickel pincer cofactor biosynthesis protein LarC [Gemmatimonadaceae bacterium]|nr:nickel pincer cofactor biosynthesis protein LarC [Gemmatimonadaceae bacterium]